MGTVSAQPSREHILCVDDEEGILTALRQQLGARFGDRCEIAVAKSADEALELIDELERDGERLAVIIADQIMPGMKGVELLEKVHARDKRTVKILLTGQAGLDAVIRAINNAGLDQYIPKPWDEPGLRLTVESLLEKFRVELERDHLIEELRALNASLEDQVAARTRELEELNSRLARLAITDGLTGLHNHRHFQERLALEVERSVRTGIPSTLLMMDVDHFKRYNDRNGHPAGDEVLRGLARLLAEGRRANDVVARYGGEEFAILLIDVRQSQGVEIAERLLERIRNEPFAHRDAQPGGRVTVSIGVGSCPDDARFPQALVNAADAALYRAKREGRDRVKVA
jgi:diguanylate cyclase (GGDEF)-like protein